MSMQTQIAYSFDRYSTFLRIIRILSLNASDKAKPVLRIVAYRAQIFGGRECT